MKYKKIIFQETGGFMNVKSILIILSILFSITLRGNAELFKAIDKGNTEKVQSLIKSDIDTHIKNNWYNGIPLIRAAQKGFSKIVDLLLTHGAHVSAGGDAALIMAVTYGHEDVVEILLNAGANVDACGETPLLTAIRNGDTSIARLLLTWGANVHECDETLLLAVVEHADSLMIHLLLSWGAHIQTLLFRSIEKGDISKVRLLLKWVYDICDQDDKALSLAIQSDNEGMIRLIMGEIYKQTSLQGLTRLETTPSPTVNALLLASSPTPSPSPSPSFSEK